jgi:aminoglycoside phosphotransferase (APT) family kinase protein
MPNPPTDRARSALIAALQGARDAAASVLAEPIAWGDGGMTLRCERDGMAFAARWHEGRTGQSQAASLAARTTYLADSGIATPGSTTVIRVDHPMGAWTVSPWCEGALGPHQLADPSEALHLAAAMGSLSARIARIDPAGSVDLALDGTWISPQTLAAAATRWVDALGEGIDGRTRRVLVGTIESLEGAGHPWRPTVAHGDLVPINVVVTADRRLVVLDLEHMAIGPPALDAAWWGWVVRLHHPDAWLSTWPTFLEATGLTGLEASPGILTAIGRVRALQRTIQAPEGSPRARWVERLIATEKW